MSATTESRTLAPGQQVRFRGPSGRSRTGWIRDVEHTPTIAAHGRHRLVVSVADTTLAVTSDDLLPR